MTSSRPVAGRSPASHNPAKVSAPAASPSSPGDELTDGGEERLRSETWPNQNTEPGDTILAKVRGFRMVNGRNGPAKVVDLGPVVVATRAGKTAHADLSMFLGTVLAGRILDADVGRVFAIRFTGFEKSGGPNPFRNYDTFLQSDDKLRDVLTQIGAAELLSGDGLPF